MPENTVRIESSARVRARHALFAHDVADASPGRGDALPFQGGLDLPGAERSRLSCQIARTSPAIGSTRSVSGCPVIQ